MLEGHGLEVVDRGNLSGPPNPWRPPENGYRHLDAVVAWNQSVHVAVLAELSEGRMPILLFGREFWTRLVDFELLTETGMISPGDIHLLHFVETAEEAWEVLAQEYGFDLPDTTTGEFAVDV